VTHSTSDSAPLSTPITTSQIRPLREALDWILQPTAFNQLRLHGNTAWTGPELVWLTVLWVWSERTTLTNAFQHARQLAGPWLGEDVLRCYQTLTNALVKHTAELLARLWAQLQDRMAQYAGDAWRIAGWLPLAIDGTKANAPRTRANERALRSPRHGRGKRARSRNRWKNKRRRTKRPPTPPVPQLGLTLLWHIGVQMPWSWRCGPSFVGERQHACDLVQSQHFPAQTLFIADAGFTGYALWQSILSAGHQFLVRVGGNVRLLQHLGEVRTHGEIVHFWPDGMRREQQPPVVLRLIRVHTKTQPIALVTSVLSDTALSGQQVGALYAKRWGVEVQFRSLKQTFGRSALKSRTPDRARCELEWSLLGLALIQWSAKEQQVPEEGSPDPTSVSLAVDVFRSVMGGDTRAVPQRLREAVRDSYTRKGSKRGRYRGDRTSQPRCGLPQLRKATRQQRQDYKRLQTIA
jgi:hypothetical protein